MNDYKELVKRLRMVHRVEDGRLIEWEAADAIENLMNENNARKAVCEGLMYLNGQLATVAAEKTEQVEKLQAEVKRLNSENFWLCKG